MKNSKYITPARKEKPSEYKTDERIIRLYTSGLPIKYTLIGIIAAIIFFATALGAFANSDHSCDGDSARVCEIIRMSNPDQVIDPMRILHDAIEQEAINADQMSYYLKNNKY